MKIQYAKISMATALESVSNNLLENNLLLSKLNRSYCFLDSLHLFTRIHSSPYFRPDHYTLSTALTACSTLRDIAFGSQLHSHTIRTGLKAYPHVSNTLLLLYSKGEDLNAVERVFAEIELPDMYTWTTLLSACVKLGQIEYAREMFDSVPVTNVACWNAVITGYAKSGHNGIAINMFSEMHQMGIRPDKYTFACVLSLCSLEVYDFGKQVHSLVIRTGFLSKSSVVNALLTMYFSCENVGNAYQVFEETENGVYDEITFNVMIDGLVGGGRDGEGLIMFREMQRVGLKPTELTFVSVMSSCLSTMAACHLHSQALKSGFLMYTSVSNAGITMYSNCCDLSATSMIFLALEEKDLISWNAMISGYAQWSLCGSAISIFIQMQREGIEPDEFTFGSLLASSECLEMVEMIQALTSKSGLIFKVQVLNALVSAYSKLGKMNQAHELFCLIYPKNLISWNTIISGFLLNGMPLKGLELFSEFLMSKIKPNVYTLSIILSICACTLALRIGKQVHGYIIRWEIMSEISLGNALIAMYSKCGILDWSLKVFNVMIYKDVISWNSLISAFAQHGQGEEAVHCFELMRKCHQIKPDEATFNALLSACSHSGLVDKACKIFNSMMKSYGINPGGDQLSAIVDLLGRAGYVYEAERIAQSKDFKAGVDIWWNLFSACAAHGNLRLGRIVAELLLEEEHNNPSVYVLLANIYASAGQWEEAANIRRLMNKTKAIKQPGCSWISC